ncbi:MAG TPA: tyrosine-type recombinase/integrase [Pseudobacteroides sp.]|uniref:tyrosine-type recombinase/integrase n=1 Tax=Pseudobacteroides sp. TaxID=1968840 RepID=UPI002F9565D8
MEKDKKPKKDKQKRRGRNEGMVRYLEDKKIYEARYAIGVDEGGKTKYKSIYGKKKTGPGGVLERMREALQALGKGEYVEPSDKSLIVWCKEWYETYKKPTVKTNTKEKYLTSLKRIENADIADMRLKDVSQDILQKYYNKLIEKYSEETIKATHSLINGALDKAEDMRMIVKNPAKKLIIPKKDNSDEGEVKALTEDEYTLLMNELMRRSNYFMYLNFMANTGLRPGEAIALNRSDINIKDKTVNVNKTFIRKTKSAQNSPKTKSSKRIVPIPDHTLTLLTDYMNKQKNKEDSSPLFQTKNGTRLSERNCSRPLKDIGEDLKLGWVHLHTMRHTFASRLFKNKVDIKIISELLGHAKVATTYDIYVHFIDNIVSESVQVLNTDSIPEKLPEKLPEKTKRASKKKTKKKK